MPQNFDLNDALGRYRQHDEQIIRTFKNLPKYEKFVGEITIEWFDAGNNDNRYGMQIMRHTIINSQSEILFRSKYVDKWSEWIKLYDQNDKLNISEIGLFSRSGSKVSKMNMYYTRFSNFLFITGWFGLNAGTYYREEPIFYIDPYIAKVNVCSLMINSIIGEFDISSTGTRSEAIWINNNTSVIKLWNSISLSKYSEFYINLIIPFKSL